MHKLINVFEPTYIRHLKNPHTCFNNTTVKVALKHLHDSCEAFTAYDLDRNSENMKTPWNQDESLENFFHQIENGVLFSEQGRSPISNAEVIIMTHVIMAQAQLFKDACK